MRHQKQAGKAGGHQQCPSRIAKGGIVRLPRLIKLPFAVLVAGLKLIIVAGGFPIDRSAACVQYELRNGLFAGQVGKLFEIFLNVFSHARQDIDRRGNGQPRPPGPAQRKIQPMTAKAAAERQRHATNWVDARVWLISSVGQRIWLICERILQTGIRTSDSSGVIHAMCRCSNCTAPSTK